MQITPLARASALATTVALLALSGSPAMAAEPIARASGTGLVLSIAGNTTGAGTYAVTNDGNGESSTGSNKPAISLLGNQDFISVGTIAQDAVTSISAGDGSSAACSGVAGQGASLAAAGSGSCLSGGNALNLTPAQIDLNKILGVQLIAGTGQTSITGLLGTIPGADTLLQPVIDALQTQIDTILAPLAGAGVVIGAGAIQSSCTATPTSADGTSNIADAAAYIQLPAFGGQPAQRVNLLNFPSSPPPNTNVVLDLDTVLNTLVDGLKTSFATSAQGALAPIFAPLNNTVTMPLLTALQQNIINTAVAQISSQLGPVDQNILSATLNKQSRTGANQITVTAIDLNVLPAAAPFIPAGAAGLLTAQIGTSSCGPNGRRAVAPAVAPSATAAPAPNRDKDKDKDKNKPAAPKVPTSVPAGLADAPTRNAPLGPLALAGVGMLLAASVGAGASAYRRSARS